MPAFRSPRARRASGLTFAALLVCGTAWSSSAGAQAEPPIRNAQDAACRDQARAQVFSTPDPRGLGPYAIGRQIYNACMRRGASQGRRPRRAR